jgi:predicted metal-dependent peptidase
MPWEDGANVEGVSAADQADIERLTAEAIRDSLKGRGHVPGSWIEWAKDILRPAHIPWDQLLSAGMRRAITDVSGMVIHSYSRPSRRQNAVPDVVLPCMRRPIPFVCFVGDTSGSMGPDDLALVRGVVEDVCMSLGARIAFLATDADVQGGVQNVGGGSSVEMRGRGGTDMCVGIDYALTQLLPRPNVIVVATDCDTPWPAEDPGVPVIVCAIGRDASVENVPPWATCIPVVEEGQAIHDYDEW